MKQIQAPNFIDDASPPRLFLAGSIEMGLAENWQTFVVGSLANSEWVILNPRRNDWDSTWEQTIENEKFVEQVVWELTALQVADMILFYFDPTTKSPITLLELGIMAERLKHTDRIIVVCPEGFWRKGNVDIVCNMFGLQTFDKLDDAIKYLNFVKDDKNVKESEVGQGVEEG